MAKAHPHVEGLHYVRDVVVQEVVTELGESTSNRWIEGVPEASAINGGDTIGLGLLVDDVSASVVQHICTPQLLHQGPILMRLALCAYFLPRKEYPLMRLDT